MRALSGFKWAGETVSGYTLDILQAKTKSSSIAGIVLMFFWYFATVIKAISTVPCDTCRSGGGTDIGT